MSKQHKPWAPYQAQLGPNPSAAEIAKLNKAFLKLSQNYDTRYYISFGLQNSYNPVTRRRDRAAWPILFNTREDAQAAMDTLPIFVNTGPAGIKSACIETTRVRRYRTKPNYSRR